MKKYLSGSLAIAAAVMLASFSRPPADSKQSLIFYFNPSIFPSASAVENPFHWRTVYPRACNPACVKACRIQNVPAPFYHWDAGLNSYILNTAQFIASNPGGVDALDREMIIPSQEGCESAKFIVVQNNGFRILSVGTPVNSN